MTESNFFERVHAVTRQIPRGRVSTYGAIARYLGSPQSSRMVGWALNSTKNLPEWIPAHRVVNRNGLLTGKNYFPGKETMRELLESEGVVVKENMVVNLSDYLWDPTQELDI